MQVQTEWHDGLEFEKPTWDPTPVEWVPRGSWARDPALEERLKAAIREAVPNHEALVAEALAGEYGGELCRTYWGSHGCDRTAGHTGLHVCGWPGDLCSAILPWGEGDSAIAWWSYQDDEGDETDSLTLSCLHWTWFK